MSSRRRTACTFGILVRCTWEKLERRSVCCFFATSFYPQRIFLIVALCGPTRPAEPVYGLHFDRKGVNYYKVSVQFCLTLCEWQHCFGNSPCRPVKVSGLSNKSNRDRLERIHGASQRNRVVSCYANCHRKVLGPDWQVLWVFRRCRRWLQVMI